MLLSLMRKHAQSWIIKFLIAIIAVVFIFYFGYSFRSDEGIKIAEVNGEPIGTVEYENEYRDMRDKLQKQYQGAWSDKLIEIFDLKKQALERLINQRIVSQEAERLGLTVTKNEIQGIIIESLPGYVIDGEFDKERYRVTLARNLGMSPEAFERDLSNDLLKRKLVQFLSRFIVPGNQEILDYYRFTNEKVKLSFVKFSPDEFKSSVEKDKESINAFFEERKENYRIPEKIKIGYIKISPDKFSDKVKLDESLLMGYYEDNIRMFTQEEQVKARHILFRVAPDASPEDQKKIEEKAKTVLERAKKGEDFAALAKEFSEDPSKANGGDIGYLKRGDMIREFEDAVFNLNKGEISDIVKTVEGYEIIKVDDKKENEVKPFPEVRGQIESIMRRNSSMDMANERALDLLDQMPYDVELKEYAKENEAPYSSTDFFSKSAPVPVIRGDSKIRETLFALEKGDVTELVELNNEFFIFQIIDKKDSYLPELDEVNIKVEVDYIDHMALEHAKTEAEKYLQELKENGNWEELAREKNRTVESTNFFTRRGAPAKIDSAPGLQDTAFKLNADNPYPDTIFENTRGAFVVKWEEKQDIDEAKYEEEKETYTQSLIRIKQDEVYMDWLDKVKAKSDIDRSYFEKIK